jgi:hypothetical protein
VSAGANTNLVDEGAGAPPSTPLVARSDPEAESFEQGSECDADKAGYRL